MSNSILHKRSSTASAVPAANTLTVGELAINTADGKVFTKKVDNTVVEVSSNNNHTHAASAITSGTLDISRIPTGSTSTTVCIGNDSRLSDARTPTSHTHGNITNAGAIGSTANLPLITTTGGAITTGSFGSAANTFCQGNDSRLSDARTPTAHVHGASDITSGTFDIARIPTGSTSTTVCIGNDSRLSDTRTPTDNTVSTAKIVNANVTYAKIQNVSATDRILGRATAGAGTIEEITCTSFARTLLDDADASTARGTLGLGSLATQSGTFSGTSSGTNTGDQTISLSGDASGSGTGAITITLANSGVGAGTYRSVTVDAKGRVTAGTNPTTISGYAISDAYTKTEIDGFLQGLDPKASVRAATTANITLSGTQTIDGVSVVANDRVLVKDQSTASQNGIYIVSATTWTRATDMDTWAEVPGTYVFVEEGTSQADFGYVCTANAGGTLNTTAITWVQFNGAANITAGDGLTKSGNTLNVASSGGGSLTIGADSINLTSGIATPGTYRSLTVDTYGRVTSGTNPTTLSGYGITDAASSAHTHGNITNAGAIGSTANLPLITTTSGVITVSSFGTTANTFCQGNDSRLSDARTPTAHVHGASDITSGTFDIARIPTGSTSTTVCIGNDSRLSDTRTPTDNTVSTAKIVNANVTYAKIQNVSAADRILGRATAGAGDIEEITCTSFARTILDDADAATARTTLQLGSLATLNGVFTSQIGDNAVTTSKIADNAVTGTKITNNTIPLSKIGKLSGAKLVGTPNLIGTQDLQAINLGAGIELDLFTGGDTLSVIFGTTSTTACRGDDSRLSDARTPTSHTHGNITNAGAIGSTANLPIITTTSGVLTTGSFGTAANTFCQGNDSRLWSSVSGLGLGADENGFRLADINVSSKTGVRTISVVGNGAHELRIFSGGLGQSLIKLNNPATACSIVINDGYTKNTIYGDTYIEPDANLNGDGGLYASGAIIGGSVESTGAVIAQGGVRVGSGAVSDKTGSYTLTASDDGKIITVNSASATTITVGTAVGTKGFSCTIIQLGTGQVTIAASSVTLNSYSGLKIAGQHGSAGIFCYATNTFNVSGNMVV